MRGCIGISHPLRGENVPDFRRRGAFRALFSGGAEEVLSHFFLCAPPPGRTPPPETRGKAAGRTAAGQAERPAQTDPDRSFCYNLKFDEFHYI